MKIWLLLSLLIGGCASKEHEFQKSLDKPESSDPQIQVEADASILEKFEVEKIETPVSAKTSSSKSEILESKKASRPKSIPVAIAKVKKNQEPKPKKRKYPSNYPPEYHTINSKAEKVWQQYRPNHQVDEKIFLDIHYLGMTVGKIMVTNRGKKLINGKEVWHFHSRFKSAPFYSNIYELDDTVDTYVTTEQFLSIRYSLIQRESKQDIDDLQLHERDNFRTYWFYKQKRVDGKVKNKEVRKPIPFYSVDPFSVLFFYQGLPLKNGDIYEIPIINKGKILILKSEVEGREEIETELGDRKAIRIHATTQYTGDHLKSGDLYFWFSDDQKHTLLKAQAKIKIGSVTADIVDD